MHIHQMEDTWQLQSPIWLPKMLRDYDQDERPDGSRHWDTIRPVLLRAFAQESTRDFDEGFWSHLIHEGSNKKRVEYCKHNNGSLCYFTSYSGTLRWYSNKSRIDELHGHSVQMEGVHLSHVGEWNISRRKRE